MTSLEQRTYAGLGSAAIFLLFYLWFRPVYDAVGPFVMLMLFLFGVALSGKAVL